MKPLDFAGMIESVAPGARSNSPIFCQLPVPCAWSKKKAFVFPPVTISHDVCEPGFAP